MVVLIDNFLRYSEPCDEGSDGYPALSLGRTVEDGSLEHVVVMETREVTQYGDCVDIQVDAFLLQSQELSLAVIDLTFVEWLVSHEPAVTTRDCKFDGKFVEFSIISVDQEIMEEYLLDNYTSTKCTETLEHARWLSASSMRMSACLLPMTLRDPNGGLSASRCSR